MIEINNSSGESPLTIADLEHAGSGISIDNCPSTTVNINYTNRE
jgi:hypothetical protein